MTRASKFRQRDVKAMIKGAIGAGVTPEELTTTDAGEIKMKIKPPSATPPTAAELDAEVEEWNRLIEADKT